jgi:hypothetical protein
MRWRLVLEEYGPELIYIKRESNVVADALSRLEIDDKREIFNLSESFGFDDSNLPATAYPLWYCDIAKAQKTHPPLIKKLASHKNYSKTTFRGGISHTN